MYSLEAIERRGIVKPEYYRVLAESKRRANLYGDQYSLKSLHFLANATGIGSLASRSEVIRGDVDGFSFPNKNDLHRFEGRVILRSNESGEQLKRAKAATVEMTDTGLFLFMKTAKTKPEIEEGNQFTLYSNNDRVKFSIGFRFEGMEAWYPSKI